MDMNSVSLIKGNKVRLRVSKTFYWGRSRHERERNTKSLVKITYWGASWLFLVSNIKFILLSFSVAQQPNAGQGRRILEKFADHTQWHITVGTTPLDEWSARRRDLYLTTRNPPKRKTYMLSAILEPAIPATDRPLTLALDRLAGGIGKY